MMLTSGRRNGLGCWKPLSDVRVGPFLRCRLGGCLSSTLAAPTGYRRGAHVLDKRLPVLPLFTSDFLTLTRMLTPEERGVFIEVACLAWEHGTLDWHRLARTVERFEESWPGLRRLFMETKSGLEIPFVENARAFAEKRRARAKRGNEAAKQKRIMRSRDEF